MTDGTMATWSGKELWGTLVHPAGTEAEAEERTAALRELLKRERKLESAWWAVRLAGCRTVDDVLAVMAVMADGERIEEARNGPGG